MRTNRKTIAAAAGAAGLLGLGLYLAVPASAGPTPSPSTSESPKTGHDGDKGDGWRHDFRGPHGFRGPDGSRGPRGFGGFGGPGGFRGGQGVHGEATLQRDKGFYLAGWQRGQITGRSGATLTVRSADGVTWTWTTDANTVVRKQGEKSTVSALANGDEVIVAGERSGNTRTAKFVHAPKKK
ncbi:DUF5666 domain-containing protein [Actinomadura roseirufa]|uniref:DUF5666 domain-containing protein n=1 Tax=Actinomadura roseirufa TaxID=2094049 RepID=UPI0010414E80|nr:DUF5666 domain-containing protein [Actinomadura roseirufa]